MFIHAQSARRKSPPAAAFSAGLRRFPPRQDGRSKRLRAAEPGQTRTHAASGGRVYAPTAVGAGAATRLPRRAHAAEGRSKRRLPGRKKRRPPPPWGRAPRVIASLILNFSNRPDPAHTSRARRAPHRPKQHHRQHQQDVYKRQQHVRATRTDALGPAGAVRAAHGPLVRLRLLPDLEINPFHPAQNAL